MNGSPPAGDSVTLTQPPCSSSNGRHGKRTALYGGLLDRCERCGLVATREVPDFGYEQGYFVSEAGGGYDFDSAFAHALDAARFRAELRRLEEQGLEGAVLDVGCATGSFLRHARAEGWEIAGVEVAEFARQRAESDLGVGIAGSLDELPEQARFDVVTLHHVVEHLPEPLAFLRQIRPRARRRLLVEVPNFASLASRVHGPLWRDLRPEQHVYHYVPSTLRRLVEAAGYSVVRVYTLWESLWSLRTALDTLRLLPGLIRTPRHEAAWRPGRPAGVRDVSDFRPPRGVKRTATALSRIALAPLVTLLQAAGLGDRLVLESEPDKT